MKDLTALLNEMAYREVQTYIQSGNVLFRSDRDLADVDAEEISKNIGQRFGFAPDVFLLRIEDLKDTVAGNPFETEDGKALHFYSLHEKAIDPDLDRLMAAKTPSERFALKNKIFYLYAPDGIGRSKLAGQVERALGVPVTARNWNTVRRLLSLSEQGTA